MKSSIRLTLLAFILLVPASICQAQQMGFSGPSVLSRSGSPLGRSGGSSLGFRPYLSIGARYDTNIGSVAADNQGNAILGDYYGGHASWGLYGVHRGQRNLVGLEYQGQYRAYSRSGNRQGANHFVSLNYVQQVSPRTDFYVSAGGGSYAYSLYNYSTPLISNPLEGINDPADEGFDSRTNSISGSGGLRHMLSSRLSIGFGGQAFYISRKVNSLIDSQGYSASGSVDYQVSRTQTISGNYSYRYYFFPNNFGESRIHSASIGYQHQLSPVWNFSLEGGLYRLENERLIRVQIDPILAAITGQRSALEAAHSITFRPSVGATLGRKFERASLSFHYNRGVSPGNGFMTTSERETAGVSYSYTATDKLGFHLNFGGQRHTSLAQNIGRFTSFGGGGGFSYRLWHFIHLTSNANLRQWKLNSSDFDRLRLSAWAGISLSPGELPLSLW